MHLYGQALCKFVCLANMHAHSLVTVVFPIFMCFLCAEVFPSPHFISEAVNSFPYKFGENSAFPP